MTHTEKQIEESVEALNKEFLAIIKEFAPNWYGHLADTDENKGEKFRAKLRTTLTSFATEREEAVADGYRLAVKHLREAVAHNGATTCHEAVEWLEDNVRLMDTPLPPSNPTV